MNVNPIVRKHGSLIDDECDRQKVAVFQARRRFDNLFGCGRIEALDQVAHRHRRNHVIRGLHVGCPFVLHLHARDPIPSCGSGRALLNLNTSPADRDTLTKFVPHHQTHRDRSKLPIKT